jgi:aryl-alcohol dehydrogenase-like predicted oxidoreductase
MSLLPRAPLGRTGLELSRVGFGAWATGGGGWRFGWGDQDDRESIAAIHYAVSQGVNWIDTAPVYGRGHSEEVVGAAVRALPAADRPYVFTKCGLIVDDRHPTTGPRNVLAPRSIRREVEQSLRRLGIERIDLYQVHWPPEDGTALDVYWSTMLDLQREGVVRAVGLSNHRAAQVAAAEKIGHVDALQPPFSLINRDAAADLLPWCAEHETGAIVYSPMQSGLLSGAMTMERVRDLPDDDWRRSDPQFTGDNLRRNLDLAQALALIARRRGTSLPAVAVGWTLCFPGVTGAIVGARRPEQVRDWLSAPSINLTGGELAEISAAVAGTGAGTGPTAPAWRTYVG